MNPQTSIKTSSLSNGENKETTLEHTAMEPDTAMDAYHEGMKKGEKHAAELWDSEDKR